MNENLNGFIIGFWRGCFLGMLFVMGGGCNIVMVGLMLAVGIGILP